MIQSMTGYGAAQCVAGGVSYSLEIRSVNNRYLKLVVKLPDTVQFLESEIDKLLRKRLVRGSVHYALRIRYDSDAETTRINVAALQGYAEQVAKVRLPAGVKATIDLSALAMLPGVCEVSDLDEQARKDELATVTALTQQATDAVVRMRVEEGEAICRDLSGYCQTIRTLVSGIAERAPLVIDEYHQRLKSRVEVLMKASALELEAEGLMREVAIFAERCDIGEEVARLGSHVDQFLQLCQGDELVGRTLDFLTQEMLREANTIASKSNDGQITRSVVELKGLIDRLKEQVQNVQ